MAVFVCTRVGEGAVVPKDVVRVRIDPTVLVIPERAFARLAQLEEVQLSDGVRSIGNAAFSGCRKFTKFRCPPLVTIIPGDMFNGCNNMFSLEFTESIIQIEDQAFGWCFSLRNVALSVNTLVDVHDMYHAFVYCTDLLQIFDTVEAIVNALKIRFAELPVHSKMYFISYYNTVTSEGIHRASIIGEHELDPSGLQQDCLGMTPLHILACSTVQCLELYRLLVEKYPANMIVEDSWRATPLLYAIWGDAPSEVVRFLVDSYQSLFPNHQFDWNAMLLTLGRASVSKVVMQNLLNIQHALSPGYNIDWDRILGELAVPTEWNEPHANPKTFCSLTRCSIATRVNAIGVKHFRDVMDDYWMGDNKDDFDREEWRDETLTKLEYYESKYRSLKEMTSLLELALWKIKFDDSRDHSKAMSRGKKQLKMDPSDFRLQCRVSCGADHVVENVWPFLLPPEFVRSYVR